MRNMRIVILLAGLLALFSVPLAAQPDEVVLLTYDSFAISEELIEAFEQETGYALEILRLEDAGLMVNQAILTKDNPLGDVIYGVDNTFLGRALNNELFVPYVAAGLDEIPEEFQLDAEENRVTPVTYGDVCLNYDVAYFEANELELPQSLADLTDEAYAGLLVVENPAASSPGLAFLLATIAEFGEDEEYTWLDYWADLVENDVLVVDGWTEAYYGEFTAASEDGDRPLVVSYASSPPAEVIFADPPVDEAPTGALVADGMCFRQVEFVGVLAGAENIEGAQAFVDFAISLSFQEDLPLNMFVFPVNPEAELPEAFVEYALIPENPAALPYEQIDEMREEWIEAWTESVLQ